MLTPGTIDDEDARLIENVLGTVALDVLSEQPKELLAYLQELSELQLDERFRASVWGLLLSATSAVVMRKMLHASVECFVALKDDTADLWGRATLIGMEEHAAKEGESSIAALVEQARSEEQPLKAIAAWARKLEFSSIPSEHPSADPDYSAIGDSLQEPEQSTYEKLLVTGEKSMGSGMLGPVVGGAQEQRWLQRLLSDVADPAETQSVARRMSEFGHELVRLTSGGQPLDVITLARVMNELEHEVAELRRRLPDEQRLSQTLGEAEAVWEDAKSVFDAPLLDSLATDDSVSIEILAEITAIYRDHGNTVRVLPQWMLAVEPSKVPAEDCEDPCFALLRPQVRQRVALIVEALTDCGEYALGVIRTVPPPPPSRDPEDYIENAISAALRVGTVLERLPASHRDQVISLIDDPQVPHDAVYAVLDALNDLQPSLQEATLDAALEYLCAAARDGDSSIAVRQVQVVMNQTKELFGIEAALTPRQFQAAIAQVSQRRQDPTTESSTTPMAFANDFVDSEGRRVVASYYDFNDNTRPYGTVAVPLVVQSKTKLSLDISVEIKYTAGKLARAWPSSWERASPERLTIAAMDWRSAPQDPARYVFPFELVLPMRAPETGTERIEARIRGLDDAGTVVIAERTLEWQGIQTPTERIRFAWRDVVEPSQVEAHPIGAQIHHKEIIEALSEGGSVMVVAPRRFGKTTLVEYLFRQSGESGLAAPPPIVCTSEMSRGRLDYDSIWAKASDYLQRELGAGINRPWDDGLPEETAFDHARRAARRQGKAAIVILFDEAQLLFPSRGGAEFGNLLKDRLERHWARPDVDDMAPVAFGFLGLPSLIERAGGNLVGALAPFEGSRLDPSKLNQLVLRLTDNRLATTRAARLHLVKRAGNLYILKTLLQRLVEHCNDRRRAWANVLDVESVERRLRTDLEAGVQHVVVQYVRDVFTKAEDVSDWQPRECYPTAVAVAAVDPLGRLPVSERVEAIRRKLDDWCSKLQPGRDRRLVYTAARVEEHLNSLDELGVLHAGCFESPILRSWLVGVGKRFPSSEVERDVLFRGALERIRIPDGLEPVAGGAQANVYRFTREGVSFALRKVRLASEEQQARFIETLETLRVLKEQPLLLREPGAEFIYNLDAIGVAEDDGFGVEIYHWVPGQPMSEKVSSLSAAAVADLGSKLARALVVLEKYGVLHRDIRPSNLILEDSSARPVLIDFGLSRASANSMGTSVAGDAYAPEVRAGKPAWSHAADVYGFGYTLRSLLARDQDDSRRLEELLERCCSDDPRNRPVAKELVNLFDESAADCDVRERRESAWLRVSEITREDREQHEWFSGVLSKFRAKFEAIELGLHDSAFERCAELAMFLAQVLEAFPTRDREPLRLGRVKHKNDVTGTALVHPAIDLLHALRVKWAAHVGRGDARSRILTQARVDSDEELMPIVVHGAELIGRQLYLSTLPRLVGAVIGCP